VGANFYSSLLYIAPCTYITPHAHPRTDEFNVISQGKMSWWMFPQSPTGQTTINGTAKAGDVVFSPLGVPHLLYNAECEGLVVSHLFSTSTTEEAAGLWATVAGFPTDYLDNVLDGAAKGARVEAVLPRTIPDGAHTYNRACAARCGIPASYYTKSRCPALMPGMPNLFASLPGAVGLGAAKPKTG
jgi:mannose-6-phosphate isomerase-like protein (cupin superfamily)